jgi:hypothetical protein
VELLGLNVGDLNPRSEAQLLSDLSHCTPLLEQVACSPSCFFHSAGFALVSVGEAGVLGKNCWCRCCKVLCANLHCHRLKKDFRQWC